MTLKDKAALVLSSFIVLTTIVSEAQVAHAPNQQAVQVGEQVFVHRCLQCHSVNPNQVLLGPSLWGEMSRSPHKKTAQQVRVILRDGKGKMPSWKDILSPEDVNHLIAYLHSL
jgi:mono/diheme cytochrome c family protein